MKRVRSSSLLALACVVLVALVSPLRAQAPEQAPPPKEAPAAAAAPSAAEPKADTGDTAWMLVSTALVMLMTPALALFYGGMVRRKNILATMMHSMICLAVVGVFWIAIGYALAFGPPVIGGRESGILGFSSELVFLKGVKPGDLLPGTGIPVYVHVLYQGMFAIITPALISGALAERIRFKTYLLFVLAWMVLVYCPLAHMVWAMDWWQPVDAAKPGTTAVGILGHMGALDFAGGTVVHIAAGLSALAAILVLRRRFGHPETAFRPNSLVLTLVGAGLLWFGWFGFNGGSGLAINNDKGSIAASAFLATQAAAAAAGVSWVLAEWFHRGKPTALGLASGIVAGLVAVTPASGFVLPWGGLLIGLVAGVVCYVAVCLKPVLKYDDSLDAFGVHGVGGFLGAILTGVFCTTAVNAAVPNEGLLLGGGLAQVVIQLIAAAVSVALAFVVSLVLVKLLDAALGFTVDREEETAGLDTVEHGEVGFDFALESMAEPASFEPRAALVPPNGTKHFSVVVDGADTAALASAWSALCQPSSRPPADEFRAIYPYMTTVSGNRFRFRGGEPAEVKDKLQRLLSTSMGGQKIQAHVER